MVNIVTINVSQTVAPAPSTLQKTGAFVSQGGTTTTVDTLTLLTEPADYTPIMPGALAITTAVWASSVVTITTTTPHGYTNGETIELTIAGMVPTGYNGTFACTITGASTFTYPLTSSPGTMTTAGVYTPEDVAETLAMVTTFFAQGKGISVYVLELGVGTAAAGVTALTSFLVANPKTIYSFLVPRPWSDEETFLNLIAAYEATTAMTYFFVTMTIDNYTSFTPLMKDVFGLVEAPTIPVTEFTLAATFAVTLSYAPSDINQVTPLAFSFLTDVTPYPLKGNNALFVQLKAAGVNYVGTGAEGGISNAILLWGTTMDVRPFNYWFAVDWTQINLQIDLANEIINGSNNPQAPLYYDQPGINRLQKRAQGTMNRGVTFGMILPPVNVTAVSFGTYVTDNPGDYPAGVYNGLASVMTPQRGFESITFNLNVTDFPTA